MTTAIFLKAFFTILVVFLVLDALWIGFVALDMFKRTLGAMIRSAPNIPAIIAFYLIYATALTLLVIAPSLDEGMSGTLWRAALFGLAAYATYDLTNLATLNGWTPSLAITDIAWGTFATTVACLTARAVVK